MEDVKESPAPQLPPLESFPAKIAAALAKAQGAFSDVAKNKTVKMRGETAAGKPYEIAFKYADLAAIINAVKKPLSENGLAHTFTADVSGSIASVTALLIHSSGESLSTTISSAMPKDKFGNVDIKKLGIHLTYLRRYSLQMLLDVVGDDDADADGNDMAGDMDEAAEYAAEQKRKFNADPKNQPYRPETSPDTGPKPISADQKKRLLMAADLENFKGIKNTLTEMVKTLTFADADTLLKSLRSETAKDSPKAKLRGMVNKLGNGYSVEELKFAALTAESAQEWIESFDPMSCPFITLNERGE